MRRQYFKIWLVHKLFRSLLWQKIIFLFYIHTCTISVFHERNLCPEKKACLCVQREMLACLPRDKCLPVCPERNACLFFRREILVCKCLLVFSREKCLPVCPERNAFLFALKEMLASLPREKCFPVCLARNACLFVQREMIACLSREKCMFCPESNACLFV